MNDYYMNSIKERITILTRYGYLLNKRDFTEEQLRENLLTVYNSIEKNKPTGVKGRYFESFSVCTSMSPSIRIELSSLKKSLSFESKN